QRPGDRPAVREVVTQAFGRSVVADLAEALEATGGHGYVASVGGRIAGQVRLSRSWVDAPARLVEVLVLSPLSVHSELRGRGIGGGLVRHALAEAVRIGAPLVFLEGDPRYYGRFGFEPASRRGFTAPSV